MLNRMLGMIYLLMNKGTVTAGELAERFEVSVRTIYRDVEALSMAGIPVYAKKGKTEASALRRNSFSTKCWSRKRNSRRFWRLWRALRKPAWGRAEKS